MITQFKGERRKDAIINHFSLDIEEGEIFFKFIKDMGYEIGEDDDVIESLHNMWEEQLNK